MQSSNFWIGTLIGSLSALLGAIVGSWFQYRLRIREGEDRRRREASDNEEGQRRREAEERAGLISMLSDIHNDHDSRERVQMILSRYLERYPGSSSTRSAEKWIVGMLSENRLEKMALAKLRTLYATVANAANAIQFPVEAEREEMIAFLWKIHTTPDRDRLRRIIEKHTKMPLKNFDWAALLYEDSEATLRRMSLSELRILYTTALNLLSLTPLSEISERNEQIADRLTQLFERLEHQQTPPADEASRKE
jgi:hypothetical protein